jgi:hypothetical protein
MNNATHKHSDIVPQLVVVSTSDTELEHELKGVLEQNPILRRLVGSRLVYVWLYGYEGQWIASSEKQDYGEF